MWATFGVVLIAVVFFVGEWVSLELVALAVIGALLALFHFAPLPGPGVENLLTPEVLLSGFANTALITILALLVIGQGLHQSGALVGITQTLSKTRGHRARLIILASLVAAGVISAFLNNTPVVVMFIPVVAALANRYGPGATRMLIPLSYITILGGMVTLVGSSTNLLVAGRAAQVANINIGFFDLFMPGIVLAGVGGIYTLFIAPRLLKRKNDPPRRLVTSRKGVQFLSRLTIQADQGLVGEQAIAGMFPSFKGVTVRLVKRGKKMILPPFEGIALQAGDIVQFAGTRDDVTRLIDLTFEGEHLMMAEAAIAPASRLGGRKIIDEEFTDQTGCFVVGIQRHKRMTRDLHDKIRLRPGDVLLIAGTRANITKLRLDRDLMVLEGSVSTLPAFTKARLALGIFAGVVTSAALGLVPIVVASLIGALVMILSGCLTIVQASRAIDRRIVLLIAASIAMSLALEKTGGAHYVASGLLNILDGYGTAVIISGLFLLIAVLTNLLSNSATALLFTPVALDIAVSMGASPVAFVHCVIFAANCSFASPMGYQTNLLVMRPGNYRFKDFFVTGGPLVILIWVVFSLLVPWYYQL